MRIHENGVLTDANHAYISYYSFGGKLVGMRRANQPSQNGQYRIVGDHLGSTSLVVDASSSPQVVSRQYYKPYGAVAWAWGTVGMAQMTSVGYTGQRVDVGSGLMYYGARFYDPVLSHFVSADTVAPSSADPKTRNRYNYVANNPLGNTDPTGRILEHAVAVSAGGITAEETEAYFNQLPIEQRLKHYGFDVDPAEWDEGDLALILEAIHDFLARAGIYKWDIEGFKHLIGLAEKPLVRVSNASLDGHVGATSLENGIRLDASDIRTRVAHEAGVNTDEKTALKYFFVHELAHLWDLEHDLQLSEDMHHRLYSGLAACDIGGALQDECNQGLKGITALPPNDFSVARLGAGVPVSDRAGQTRREDWAEAVAAEVYPRTAGGDPLRPSSHHGSQYYTPDGTQARSKYVQEQFDRSRWGGY